MFKSAQSAISVKNQDEAKKFYTEVLGFKLLDESMGLLLELPGGMKLFAYEKSDHQPATFTVLNLETEDIESAISTLKEKGVSFEHYDLGGGAVTGEDGILRGKSAGQGPDIAWFKDPSQNIIAVMEL